MLQFLNFAFYFIVLQVQAIISDLSKNIEEFEKQFDIESKQYKNKLKFKPNESLSWRRKKKN